MLEKKLIQLNEIHVVVCHNMNGLHDILYNRTEHVVLVYG